jgi:hypothetical protein
MLVNFAIFVFTACSWMDTIWCERVDELHEPSSLHRYFQDTRDKRLRFATAEQWETDSKFAIVNKKLRETVAVLAMVSGLKRGNKC